MTPRRRQPTTVEAEPTVYAHVMIQVNVSLDNVQEFLGAWEQYCESLKEYGYVEYARMELPAEGPRMIELSTR